MGLWSLVDIRGGEVVASWVEREENENDHVTLLGKISGLKGKEQQVQKTQTITRELEKTDEEEASSGHGTHRAV